jgi:hypothetical protein
MYLLGFFVYQAILPYQASAWTGFPVIQAFSPFVGMAMCVLHGHSH